MSAVYKSQIRLRSVVGTGRNDVVSTLHFYDDTDQDIFDVAESCAFQHIDFINQDHGLAASVARWISSLMSRAADETAIEVYRLEDAIPRTARYSNVFQLTAEGPAEYCAPRQLAVALSYHGILTGVAEGQPGVEGQPRPRSRRRGRTYIGPLVYSAFSAPATGLELRPSADLIASLGEAGKALLAGDADPLGGVLWCVWSPTAGVAYPAVGCSVDNRFDVQRRRASEATVRTEFP